MKTQVQMLKIKANQKLFDKWKLVGRQVELLSAIVQNDMELPAEEIIDWQERVDKAIRDLEILKSMTLKEIEGAGE